MACAEEDQLPIVEVRAGDSGLLPYLRNLVGYNELLYFLVWRDLKVRYKQTVLGVAWAVLQPLATMLVFSIFFGKLAHVPSDGIPYPIFVYCALVPWQMFSSAITEAANSLVQNQYLLSKVYFRRIVIPLAPVLTATIDSIFAYVLLGGMMIYYGIGLHAAMLLLPLFLLFAALAAFAVGIWLAALTAEYRDVRYTLPFLVQLWLFITPIAYPASLVPARWRLLYGLNPMNGVVEGMRWTLLGAPAPQWNALAASFIVVVLLLVSGVFYFRRLENTLADVL